MINAGHAMTFARMALIPYAIAQWEGYKPADHHRLIANALERVVRGECKRLMIFMPPRHGKSMLVSEFFPPFYLGNHPDHYIITATYAQELAEDFGRKVRNQVSDPLHHQLFNECNLSSDSTSASRFATQEGGTYFAVGVGGPITGRGAHLLLIDDPVKGREEAESESMRRRMKDWYTSVAYTRLMPGAAVVVIQTRWHEDDLSGWLLREHQHENWEVISLPAINANGEALWTEAYPIERLQDIQKAVGPRDWNALYQQNPIPDEGEYFRREWFQFYDTLPHNMALYGASDYAVTDGAGDYTEHGVFGVDERDNLYIVDWWSGQTNAAEWIDAKLAMVNQWQPQTWFGEAGVIRRSVEPFMVRRMEEKRIYVQLEWLPSMTNKAARARAFQGRAANRKVFLPRKAPWVADLLSQLLHFPAGVHDDKVDVCSMIGQALQSVRPPAQKEFRRERYIKRTSGSKTAWAA